MLPIYCSSFFGRFEGWNCKARNCALVTPHLTYGTIYSLTVSEILPAHVSALVVAKVTSLMNESYSSCSKTGVQIGQETFMLSQLCVDKCHPEPISVTPTTERHISKSGKFL